MTQMALQMLVHKGRRRIANRACPAHFCDQLIVIIAITARDQPEWPYTARNQ